VSDREQSHPSAEHFSLARALSPGEFLKPIKQRGFGVEGEAQPAPAAPAHLIDHLWFPPQENHNAVTRTSQAPPRSRRLSEMGRRSRLPRAAVEDDPAAPDADDPGLATRTTTVRTVEQVAPVEPDMADPDAAEAEFFEQGYEVAAWLKLSVSLFDRPGRPVYAGRIYVPTTLDDAIRKLAETGAARPGDRVTLHLAKLAGNPPRTMGSRTVDVIVPREWITPREQSSAPPDQGRLAGLEASHARLLDLLVSRQVPAAADPVQIVEAMARALGALNQAAPQGGRAAPAAPMSDAAGQVIVKLLDRLSTVPAESAGGIPWGDVIKEALASGPDWVEALGRALSSGGGGRASLPPPAAAGGEPEPSPTAVSDFGSPPVGPRSVPPAEPAETAPELGGYYKRDI